MIRTLEQGSEFPKRRGPATPDPPAARCQRDFDRDAQAPLVTRTALVASVGSGIGKAITSRSAAEGCVVIADLNPDSLVRRSVRSRFPGSTSWATSTPPGFVRDFLRTARSCAYGLATYRNAIIGHARMGRVAGSARSAGTSSHSSADHDAGP